MNKKIFRSDRIDHIEVFIMMQVKVWSLMNSKVCGISFSF